MNGDEIKGIAILDRPRETPCPEHLLCYCVRADGKLPILISLPVRPRGTPEVAKSWEYDIQGDEIHVTPSVKVSWNVPSKEFPDDPTKDVDTEMFHNPGDWRVKFERTTPENPGGYELFCLRNGRNFV